MLQHDRTKVYEGIDVSKTNGSRECIICQYWCFLDIKFKFQPEVCNGCHDLMQKSISFNDVALVTVKGNDYRNIKKVKHKTLKFITTYTNG